MKKENVHAKHKKSLAERFWKQKYLFLLLLPSLVWVILICYAPMTGLYMSFINYTPQGNGYFADMANSQFVGLDWFKYFFSTDFTKIMRNTLATSLLTLLFSFPLPIILALCLNEVRNQKAKKFVQTASYIPYFISWVIVSCIASQFLSQGGVINTFLMSLGLLKEPLKFLTAPEYFWGTMVALDIWKEMGWWTIIFLAAITGINGDYYEAAQIDGASRIQRIIYITLPCIKSTIVVVLIMTMGNLFGGGLSGSNFEQAYLFGNSVNADTSQIIQTYVFDVGLSKGRYAYATAVGLIQSIISLIMIMGSNFAAKKMSGDSLY